MSSFGILSFTGTGHLHPLTALGRELARRDHTVTTFQIADVEHLIRAAGLRFHQIGELDFPLGTLRVLDGQLSGLHASRDGIRLRTDLPELADGSSRRASCDPF